MTSYSPRKRNFWADIRFLIGIAIVLASVAGVWFLISTSRQTAPVLQVSRTVVPGEAVTTSNLSVVELNLGAVQDQYLGPADLPPEAVATRTLNPGELLATSAITDRDNSSLTTVVVQSAPGIPRSVKIGASVEVWYSPASENGYDTPRVLLADAVVAAIPESTGMLSQSASDLELVIHRADVAAVLGAVASGATLAVIPLGSP